MIPLFCPRRSVLYVPGANQRALDKATGLAADALILDLEDPVAPGDKASARAAVAAAISAGGYPGKELVIRVNGLATEWVVEDLAMAAHSAADAVLVPKIGSPSDIAAVRDRLIANGAPSKLQLWAMMETPAAVINAAGIAAAAAADRLPLTVFVVGTNDLARETRAAMLPGRRPMASWLSTIVVAARAYQIDVIDGVYNAFSDLAGFEHECSEGRDFGMDGKTLVHPGQIAVANRVFAPDVEAIAGARAIVAAFAAPEASGKAVIPLAGRMVERLHLVMAERTLAIAEAIAVKAAAG